MSTLHIGKDGSDCFVKKTQHNNDLLTLPGFFLQWNSDSTLLSYLKKGFKKLDLEAFFRPDQERQINEKSPDCALNNKARK